MKLWLVLFLVGAAIFAEDRKDAYVSPLEALESWKKKPTERKADGPFIAYPKAPPFYAVGSYADSPPSLMFHPAELYESVATDSFGAEDLKTWLKEKKITNPEELLKSFDEKPELKGYRDHRAYVIRSFSRQAGETGPTDIHRGENATDPKFVREIHYSPKGRLIFAFTNSRGADGKTLHAGKELEVFEIQKDYTLKPYLLRFDKPHGEANSCVRCHGAGQSMRLNSMGTYSLWAGMLAGSDDNQDPDEKLPENRFLMKMLQEDLSKGTLAHASWPKQPSVQFPTGMRANLMFHQYAHVIQFKKLALMLTKSKVWDSYRYAFIAAFEGCEDLPSFLTAPIAMRHEARLGLSYDHLWRDTQVRVAQELEQREKIYREINQIKEEPEKKADIPLQAPAKKDLTTNLRYLLEGQQLDGDATMKYWSLSFKPKGSAEQSYSYSFDSEVSSDGLKGFYHYAVIPLIAEQKIPRECEKLKELSQKALTAAYKDFPPLPETALKKIDSPASHP